MSWWCTSYSPTERRFAQHLAMAGAWSNPSKAMRSLSPPSQGMRTASHPGAQSRLFRGMSTASLPEMQAPSTPAIAPSPTRMRRTATLQPGRKSHRRRRFRERRSNRSCMTTMRPSIPRWASSNRRCRKFAYRCRAGLFEPPFALLQQSRSPRAARVSAVSTRGEPVGRIQRAPK